MGRRFFRKYGKLLAKKRKSAVANQKIDEHYGEVDVQVQMFKDIPLQVKLTSGTEEKRFGLPERFLNAMERHFKRRNNYILLRKWKELGVRYGELEQLGKDIVEELGASLPGRPIETTR